MTDLRKCFRGDCINIAIPYSAFCLKHVYLSDFDKKQRAKQNDFLFQNQDKALGVSKRKLRNIINAV